MSVGDPEVVPTGVPSASVTEIVPLGKKLTKRIGFAARAARAPGASRKEQRTPATRMHASPSCLLERSPLSAIACIVPDRVASARLTVAPRLPIIVAWPEAAPTSPRVPEGDTLHRAAARLQPLVGET